MGEFGSNRGTSQVVAPCVSSRWGLWCAGVVWLIIDFSHVCGYRRSTSAEADRKCCFVMAGTPAQLPSFLFWDVLALQNSKCFPAHLGAERGGRTCCPLLDITSHRLLWNKWLVLGLTIEATVCEGGWETRGQTNSEIKNLKLTSDHETNSWSRRLKALLCQKTVCDVVIKLQIPALCFFRICAEL